MNNIPLYTQTTADTCLPSCFMMILSALKLAEMSQKLELEILTQGDVIDKNSRTLSHLLFVSNKYTLPAEYIVDNKSAYDTADNFLDKHVSKYVSLINIPINSRFIDEKLNSGVLITEINDYALRQQIHFPHFVVVTGKVHDKYEVLDPWEGKKFYLTANELQEAMDMLDQIKFWKEVIAIKISL